MASTTVPAAGKGLKKPVARVDKSLSTGTRWAMEERGTTPAPAARQAPVLQLENVGELPVRVCLNRCETGEPNSERQTRYGGVAGIAGGNDPVLAGRGAMGLGLNWAASSSVQVGADYAKQLDNGKRAGSRPDEVVRARLSLAL